MDDFVVKMNLLLDILENKKHTLANILNITENQQTILYQKEANRQLKIIFMKMNEEKQELIDEVLKSDDLFDKVFSSIKEVFEEKAELNKDFIKKLQDGIRVITDLDVRIKVEELKINKYIISEERQNSKKSINKVSKQYILDQYKKNTNKQDF